MTTQKKKAAPATARAPDLVALHVVPAPEGKKPILTPIGIATAHPDGKGYDLRLHLVPTANGRIVLRRAEPKAKIH